MAKIDTTIGYVADMAEQLAVLAEKSHDDLVAYLLRLAACAAVERIEVENARRPPLVRRPPQDATDDPG